MRTRQIPRKLVAEVQANVEILSALLQLKQAHDLAAKIRKPLSPLAVELPLLIQRNSSKAAIEWLVAAGLAEHFLKGSRFTRPQPSQAKFTERSCFLLSERGLELARHIESSTPSTGPSANGSRRLKPRWDASSWQLWLGSELIKKFGRLAPNQMPLLTAFQNRRWAATIDDPLPIAAGRNRRRRLENAITRLNSSQSPQRLKFHLQENGKKIGWEIIRSRARNRQQS